MTITPMMSQWHSCKLEAKEAILFFRLGDFYEAFYDDAKLMAKQLNLTLTARGDVPMCGVPFHTAEGYIDKLIQKGHKVAVAEQTEDPKDAKGIVKREIVRIITPGTIVNSQLINDKKNNFFVSIVRHNQLYGLSILDLTTTEFRAIELESESSLMDELCKLRPSEFLVSENFEFLKELSHSFTFITNIRNPIDPKLSFDVLTAHLDTKNLDAFGLRAKHASITAAGFLMLYLKEELNLSLDHITSIQSDTLSEFMSIDRSTMKNLELDTSFADFLDVTNTPMGARLLRQWIKYPLLDPMKIHLRQNSVEEFLSKPQEVKKAKEALGNIRDIERMIMKIIAQYATPKDVYALGVSLSFVPEVAKSLNIELYDPTEISQKILNSMNDTPPIRIGEGEIFKDGVNQDLDELRALSKESLSWMAKYQNQLREETQIKTLKVGYTRAFGYYIEVSRLQSEKIPSSFHRRQTLTNAERFITEELKEFEHKILSSEERAKAIELKMYEDLRLEIASFASSIQFLAKQIARIDVLLSFAEIAEKYNWIKPTVDNSDVLEIIDGRHPVVEKMIGSANFIANNTALDTQEQMMLITGPNMAGKSTYIRQVAIITILAQMGSYVPASSAKIAIVDKVFSRIGASDDLARGQSTFMVEMMETANILNNATSKSLVLLDEIGRGTSTYDGISIAWAVAEYLLTTAKSKAKTLFATHYWELTKLEDIFPHAVNYQTAVQEIASGIVFLRKIIKGGTDKSYGIHVAKLAGLPSKAIKRAEEMLSQLEGRKKREKQEIQTQLNLF
jgi:DNA mismatch repair protein MutS